MGSIHGSYFNKMEGNHHYPYGAFCTDNRQMGDILIQNLSPKWSIRAEKL